MHPLFHFLKRWKCKSVFQTLALEAISGIEGEAAERWQGLFLWRIEAFLRGVDAPMREFRDFANHSFDGEEPWGTAPRLAAKWYEKTAEALRVGDWNEGAHHAGVMLRYSTFSLLLSHGHHREPGVVLRDYVAWLLAERYEPLATLSDHENCPEDADIRQFENGRDLESFFAGASRLTRAEEAVILDRLTHQALGRELCQTDEEIEPALARHLGRVRLALGSVLRRVVAEAQLAPPSDPVGFAHLAAWPSLPIFWLTRTSSRRASRRMINAMRRDWSESGRIGLSVQRLPMADVEALREAYAISHQADQRSAPALADTVPLSIARSVPRELQSFEPITGDSAVGAATSMRDDIADELANLRIHSVRDLLAANPDDLAESLAPRATAADLADWRNEATLCHDIPMLSPAEAQLLVACGVSGRSDLASFSPVELWELMIPVAESPDGSRILAGGPSPGLDSVTEWIDAARLEAA